MKNHKIIEGSAILNNENNFQIGQNPETPETYAAKLAFIGTALSTLGDGVYNHRCRHFTTRITKR